MVTLLKNELHLWDINIKNMKEISNLVKSMKALALACLWVIVHTADAQVVYTSVKDGTKTYDDIFATYEIDLNKDDTVDFTVRILHMQHQDARVPGGYYDEYSANINASEGNEVLGINLDTLSSHTMIDNSLEWDFIINGNLSHYYFDGKGDPYERFGSSGSGNFVNSTGKYVGVKFTTNGKTYLGYIAIDTKNLNQPSGSFTVTGFAYESTPGKAITAGAGETVSVTDSYVKNNTTIAYLNNTIVAEFKNSFNGKIEVVNMNGQVVKTTLVNGSSVSVSTEGIPSGIYQVVVSGVEGMFSEKTLITER